MPNVAVWNQKISWKAPGRSPKDTLLGRQGRRETFRCSRVPNVAFWNQKKISRKAPGRSPKDTLLGRQGCRDTFRCSLVPNVAVWNQKKICWKAPCRSPKDTLLGRQGRRETFRCSLERCFLKPEENLLESARQVAKEHAAGPPRAPGHVSVQPSA